MWIEAYREREGLERDELARRANKYRYEKGEDPLCGYISDTLIWILETRRNAITHPVLADAIAAVCGATAEQRDMIVAKHNRGTWEPDPGRLRSSPPPRQTA